MIKRIYINNYKSLVGFELFFDSLNVLCGINGTGKSSVFDAIQFISSLATGNCFFGAEGPFNQENVVSRLDFTSWIDSTEQQFEIDIVQNENEFKYIVHLDQTGNHVPRVIKEAALCNGVWLYTRDLDGVHFDEGHSGFPLDWHQAALASIHPTPGRERIKDLQEAFRQLVILRPDVHSLRMESKAESQKLSISMDNFISWYRYLYQSQEFSDLHRDYLKEVWNDLKFMELENAGLSVKVLKLRFESVDLMFNQLSDGEKMLVCLYSVMAALSLGNVNTVLIDEPDNYVCLQELQPWFLSLSELADSEHQIIIISHNGEILDINTANTILFAREGHSMPTRIGALKNFEGMLPSEILARGWGELQ